MGDARDRDGGGTGAPATGGLIEACSSGSLIGVLAGSVAVTCAGTRKTRRSGTSVRRARQGKSKPGSPRPAPPKVKLNSSVWISSETKIASVSRLRSACTRWRGHRPRRSWARINSVRLGAEARVSPCFVYRRTRYAFTLLSFPKFTTNFEIHAAAPAPRMGSPSRAGAQVKSAKLGPALRRGDKLREEQRCTIHESLIKPRAHAFRNMSLRPLRSLSIALCYRHAYIVTTAL